VRAAAAAHVVRLEADGRAGRLLLWLARTDGPDATVVGVCLPAELLRVIPPRDEERAVELGKEARQAVGRGPDCGLVLLLFGTPLRLLFGCRRLAALLVVALRRERIDAGRAPRDDAEFAGLTY